ncbi:MAG: choice-of-anchor tandem repeat GloVer-containing protein [Candidatus Sulfotelmatobacter sp.]
MCNRTLCLLTLAVSSTLLVVALPPAHAQTEIMLYNFCSQPNCIDSAGPASSITPDGAGNLYGTTQMGGANNYGTVFELSPNGIGGYKETVLYSFCSLSNCADGDGPTADVIFDSLGNLYGTACSGGANGQGVASACSNSSSDGYGVVFELSPEPGGGCPSGSNSGTGWCETVLYSFMSNPDGAFPFSGLTWDAQGNLYGTTYGGGSGMGAVYELSPNGSGGWSESVLYSVCSQPNCADGAYPNGLVQDTSGNFYGTTENGGDYAFGTVFELSPQPASGCLSGSYTGNGWCEVILHAFAGHPADGNYPLGTPVLDSAGNIYGTTLYGGTGSCKSDTGCGTVWKLTPVTGGEYTEEILHSFASGLGTFGCCSPIRLSHYPWAGVVLDSSGNIYGTTAYGGSSSYCTHEGKGEYQGCGTLFELAKESGKKVRYKFQLLWVFNQTNGANPVTSMILDGANLYGTTYNGGTGDFCLNAEGCGLAFEFTP